MSPGTVGFERGSVYTRGSFEEETGVGADTARDGHGGIREECGTDQQQTEETEEGVQGPEEEPRDKLQWSSRKKSPLRPSRLGPR